jgi:phospholipid/cholesterol/gamma-HCH transport system permease protein
MKTGTDVQLDEAGKSGTRIYRFSGDWRSASVHTIMSRLSELASKDGKAAEVDLSDITAMDTAGAWIISRFMSKIGDVKLTSNNPRYLELLGALPDELPEPGAEPKQFTSRFARFFAPIGEAVLSAWEDTVAAMFILGSAVRGAQLKLGRHSGLSPAAIVMSFLIGAIIAQQGAFQLRYFGAELFVVDLVGILQLREIGVLLTAIMIAGRSGSAITAEIGSMKMREEIDALKVMGLSPIGVLVFPRLVALTVALPLLTIVANFSALTGAAVVAWGYSGITFATFLARLQEAVDFSSVLAGMIKAPFMALIIGVVAAVEGLKVGGSAESLGRHVTQSVVKSIFVVILVDGLFAMFYASIDF